MKYLKLFGLTAIAAVAMMAFVGAGTASATVLCKTEPTGGKCPAEWDYPSGTKGVASLEAGTTAVLETLGGTTLITCTASTVEGTSENTGNTAETVRSVLSTLTWGSPEKPCTKTIDTITPGSGELHWISGTNNGTLTTKNTAVTVNTIFGSCTYGTGEALDMGTTVGGNPGSLTINTIVPKQAGGATCPAETRFTAKYVATSPTAAWVAKE